MAELHKITGGLDELKTKFGEAGDKPVFVKFTAEWCGNCELIAPTFEENNQKLADQAVFLSVDVDEQEEIAEEYEVTSLPRAICFKGGEKTSEMFGNKPEKYQEFIDGGMSA